jgi:hypothetical protein
LSLKWLEGHKSPIDGIIWGLMEWGMVVDAKKETENGANI